MKPAKKKLFKAVSLILCTAFFLTSMPSAYANVTEDTCTCTVPCTDGAVNPDCLVCAEHPEYCALAGAPGSSEAEEPEGSGEPDDEPESTSPTQGPQIDDSYLEQIGDLQQQQNDLQGEQDRLDQLIASAQSEKQKQQLIASNIDAQISLTKQQIALLEEKITLTEKNIREKETQIEQKELEIQDGLTLFRDRIRALYLAGGNSSAGSSYLTMLLTSESVTEFLTRTEMIRRISEHDEEIISETRNELSAIEDEKADVEAQKLGLEEEKVKLGEEQDVLSVSLSTASAAIQDISAMEAEYKANREVIEAQMKQIQNEIANIYAVYNSQYTDYVGGELAWPVPGFSNITCYYGWRWGNSDFHTGIDISGGGVYGANIIAANTGTVMYVRTGGYASGYAGGYGSYLIIDHGGGISTLYAHCSSIYVSEGDVVAKGQAVAAVGSTGWSTGPHLHFEVRVDGEDVDPLPYVTG